MSHVTMTMASCATLLMLTCMFVVSVGGAVLALRRRKSDKSNCIAALLEWLFLLVICVVRVWSDKQTLAFCPLYVSVRYLTPAIPAELSATGLRLLSRVSIAWSIGVALMLWFPDYVYNVSPQLTQTVSDLLSIAFLSTLQHSSIAKLEHAIRKKSLAKNEEVLLMRKYCSDFDEWGKPFGYNELAFSILFSSLWTCLLAYQSSDTLLQCVVLLNGLVLPVAAYLNQVRFRRLIRHMRSLDARDAVKQLQGACGCGCFCPKII